MAAYQHNAIAFCSYHPPVCETPTEAALHLYRTLLRKRDYFPISPENDRTVTHFNGIEETTYNVANVIREVRRNAHYALRKARVCVMSTELVQDLCLEANRRSTLPRDQPIWSANHEGAWDRDEWEASWPNAIPPHCPPPFNPTFVAFTSPMASMTKSWINYGGPLTPEQEDTQIVAMLLTQSTCMTFMWVEGSIYSIPIFDDEKVYYVFPAFIAFQILDAFMSPEVEVKTSHLSRKQKKLLRGTGAHVTMGAPAPYYEVLMRTRLGPSNPDPEPREIEWSHRWDVRGHKRTLIRRGALPLSDRDRSKLVTRGYRIFEKPSIPFEAARALELRGKPPKRDDEWVALKVTSVRAFQKGPEDKPYVPSTHVEEWSDRLEAGS